MILIWLSARLCEWVSFTQWARRDNVKARRSKRDNRQCGHVANVAMASWIRFRMLLSSSLSSSSSSLMASMLLGETPDIIRIFAAWYTQSVLSAIQPDCTQNKVKVQSEDHEYMRTDLTWYINTNTNPTQHIDINSNLTHCVLYQKPSDTVSVCLSQCSGFQAKDVFTAIPSQVPQLPWMSRSKWVGVPNLGNLTKHFQNL